MFILFSAYKTLHHLVGNRKSHGMWPKLKRKGPAPKVLGQFNVDLRLSHTYDK